MSTKPNQSRDENHQDPKRQSDNGQKRVTDPNNPKADAGKKPATDSKGQKGGAGSKPASGNDKKDNSGKR